MAVSFSNDIMPLFNQFTGQMMWRFDLTNYDQVIANAQTIYGRINGGGMPPPPFDPPINTSGTTSTPDIWMASAKRFISCWVS